MLQRRFGEILLQGVALEGDELDEVLLEDVAQDVLPLLECGCQLGLIEGSVE